MEEPDTTPVPEDPSADTSVERSEIPPEEGRPSTSTGTVAGFDRFAHFVIQRRPDGELDSLGGGGMGITYRAFDTQLERTVALKLINPQRVSDREIRTRFLREARAAGRLQHPHIASVLFQGEEKSHCFYVMELVSGEDLHHYIDRVGPLAPVHALRIAHQIALAIVAAWQENILHRDLKPGNIMLTVYHEGGAPHVKVIDFGLAKLVTDTGSSFVTGGFLGTPEFASPEQCEEETLDVRSDLYSLGVTLWFMLTGAPPFTGSLLGIVRAQVSTPVPLEQLSAAPPVLRDLLARLMAKSPNDRPSSPLEAAREIEAAIDELRDDRRNFEPLGANGDDEIRVVQTHLPTPYQPPLETPIPRKFPKVALAISGAVLLIAAGATGYLLRTSKNRVAPATPVAASSPTHPITASPAPTPSAVPIQPVALAASSPSPENSPAPAASPDDSTPGMLALGATPVFSIAPDAELPVPDEPVMASIAPEPNVSPSMIPDTKVPDQPSATAKSAPFVNSLGMRFVESPTDGVWFCVWETRVRDIRLWTRSSNFRPATAGIRSWQTPGYVQNEDQPAVYISWNEAEKFCEWLTAKEFKEGVLRAGERYRLPHRREWDMATEIPRDRGEGGQFPPPRGAGAVRETEKLEGLAESNWIKVQVTSRADAGRPPAGEGPGGFIWKSDAWPPANRTVNAADLAAANARSVKTVIPGYEDGFAYTSPVGSFPPNEIGLYDLAGNVYEFASDGPPEANIPGKQGGSWRSATRTEFEKRNLTRIRSTDRDQDLGFRCVLDRRSAAP